MNSILKRIFMDKVRPNKFDDYWHRASNIKTGLIYPIKYKIMQTNHANEDA
jgi:hypothetical protein